MRLEATAGELQTEVIDWDRVHPPEPVSRLIVREVPDGAYIAFCYSDYGIVLAGEALDAVIDRLTRARDGALN